MKSSIIRISQVPTDAAPAPAPPPPPPMGMDMGMPPMPPAMGGAPSPAGGQPQTTVTKGMIYPLENIGMILVDAEITKKLSEIFSSTKKINTTSEQEIANDIWLMYGGNEIGEVDSEKRGKRLPKKEVDQKEIDRTENTRWERLPLGKNLEDLGITLKDFVTAVEAISFGISKAKSKEQGAGGGLAAANIKNTNLIKIASVLDKIGFYELSDNLI